MCRTSDAHLCDALLYINVFCVFSPVKQLQNFAIAKLKLFPNTSPSNLKQKVVSFLICKMEGTEQLGTQLRFLPYFLGISAVQLKC